MKLATIKKFADSLGLDTQNKEYANGKGLAISLEKTEYSPAGMAINCRMIDRETEGKLNRYLARYRVKHEYAANYTTMIIMEG
jgi:hypothetical protein